MNQETPSNRTDDTGGPGLPRDRALIQAALREAIGVVEYGSSVGRTSARAPAEKFASPASDSFPGYEITREVHRGGQGVVYQAIQKATRRKVAIKVMREGPLATPRDRARFEREVHILSQLKHPNIVSIHDSGVVGQWSFHVMDYVSGQPLDVYVAGKGLAIPQFVRLFKTICEAVNVAHLRGIVHRDLKPSNIRVDPGGEPHVLDFGLAKVSEFDVLADSHPQVMTITGQFVGSLPWASPEQAEGNPDKIDIRTDVYSLGVLLFQMLTGRFPYEVVGNMRDVLDHVIRDAPARPSAMRKTIDDELDTIVLKCLAKEHERRYQSAGELARDLDRYLKGEPIEAKRDSMGYMLRKTLGRYKVRAAVAAGFIALVMVSAVTMFVLYRQAQVKAIEAATARDHARDESQRLRAAMHLVERIMAVMAGGLGFTADKFTELDDTSGEIGREFQGDAAVESLLRVAMSMGYANLQSVDRTRALGEAEREIAAALDLRRSAFGASHPDTRQAMMLATFLHINQRRFNDAEIRAREMLEATRASYDENSPEMVNAVTLLGHVLNQANKPEEALELHRRIQPVAIRIFGPRDSRTRTVNACIANDLVYAKRYQEAEEFLLELYRDATAHADEGKETTLHTLNLLTWLYRYWGKPEEAEKYDQISKDLSGAARPVEGS